MADVFGQIGNQPVELNNAATESTLRQLLAAIQGQGGSSAAAKAAQVAATAGINNANTQLQTFSNTTNKAQQAGEKLGVKFAALHNAADSVAQSFNRVDKAIGPFVAQLISGTAKVSDFYGALSQLPGVLGTVASVFQRVAQFQETNLEAYQKITTTGTSLGGSLTQLRQSALNTYMTLDQFANLMKTNSEVFAKMGGTVDQGAKTFIKMSNSLLSSNVGNDLRALGYTTEQVNQGMLDYINITGGRSRKELQNTDAILKGSGQYLEQLDGLAKLTGESREELAKKMKEDAANQAFEGYLLTLDEEGRKKAVAAKLEAEARGGKGAAQALQAKLMGLPPMTEAAQKFVGTMKNGNQQLDSLANSVKDNRKTIDDVKRAGAGFSTGLAEDGRNLRQVGGAMIMAGKDVDLYGKALGAANTAQRNNIRTIEDQVKFEEQLKREQEAAKKSEAKNAVEAQQAVQKMGQSIMAMLLPAIKLLTPMLNSLVKGFGEIFTFLEKHKTVTIGIIAALTAYLAIQKAQLAFEAYKAARKAGAGVAGALGKGAGSVLTGKGVLGSTPLNPMFVSIVGGFGGGGAQRRPGGGGGAGQTGGAGTGTQSPANREERLRRVQEGRAAQRVGTGLKGAGIVGAVTGLAMLGSELSDIQKQKEENIKQGMDKQKAEAEAKKETGGVLGETGGGLAGGAAGAKLGAVIGTFIAPGIGTAIGGAIGGIAGGLLGAWGGRSAGEAMAGSKDLPKMAAGGIVTTPTQVLAGEAGPEAIIPLTHFENLRTELQTLNKQSADMLRYLRDTAEYTKRNVDATKSLNGDLFKF